MAQLLELSNKDFQAAIKNMLQEVKLNKTEISGKVVLKRETENIKTIGNFGTGKCTL